MGTLSKNGSNWEVTPLLSSSMTLDTQNTYVKSNIVVKSAISITGTGSATTPTASGASTNTSLNGTTLTVARSVTPTVSAGYVTSGTAGVVTITGTVPTESKTASASGDITPSSGKLLSKVTVPAGSIATSTATNSTDWTQNTTAIVPANGSLLINAGWYPNTQISLATLIPDDTNYTNAGSAQIRQNYEAYDTNGNKLIGTIANWTPSSTYYSTTNSGYGGITQGTYVNTSNAYYIKAGSISSKSVSASNSSQSVTISAGWIPASTITIAGAGLSGNATTAQVLNGQTFYSSNLTKQTGTMTNNGAKTSTITTQGGTYTIPAGYHNGSGVITVSLPEYDGSSSY